MNLLLAISFLILSLWPVGVGAETDGSIKMPKSWDGGKINMKLVYKACTTDGECFDEPTSSCYAKMQETMRVFNRYIVNPQEYRLPGGKQGAYQMPYEREVIQWKKTMRECVQEGQ